MHPFIVVLRDKDIFLQMLERKERETMKNVSLYNQAMHIWYTFQNLYSHVLHIFYISSKNNSFITTLTEYPFLYHNDSQNHWGQILAEKCIFFFLWLFS